MEETENIN